MTLYPVHERGRRARRWMLALVVAIGLASAGEGRAAPVSTATPGAIAGQALIRFLPGTLQALRQAAHARAGARVVRTLEPLGYDLVAFEPAVPVDTVLATYRSDRMVSVAEPNFSGRIALSPGDACLVEPCAGTPGQWHLKMTNAPFGWDAYPGRTFTAAENRARAGVTIAVLDTKLDASHPDFANPGSSSTDARDGGQLDAANARDWVPASQQAGAAAYHGTFVAGLAAAATGNGIDAAAIGYAARVLPLTVVDGAGNTDAARLAEAIVYAWQRGARVINLSLGIAGDSSAVRDAIRTVTGGANPALVVAAAGNNTGNAPFYPGSYPEVMSVSGTDANDGRAPCSNYNGNVSVAAPADRLIGLDRMPNERMQAACGTSAAAPQVSGLAALLMSQNTARSPAQVRGIIERSADDLGAGGRDDRFGHGRINVERALRSTGPVTTTARSTIVVARGGSSTVTAVATSAAGVRRAELVFDRPDAAPVAMQAADGAFGGTTEALRATVSVPSTLAHGPHPIWVRAFDGSVWGARTAGVVVIDQRAPSISGVTTSNAMRAIGEPLTVRFTVSDDYSAAVHFGVQFYSSATGALMFQDSRANVPSGAQTYRWSPGLEVPGGPYNVKIIAVDQASNAASTMVGAVVT